MQFGPGDALELESEVTGSLCGPVRPKVTLKKECGVSVYQGEPTVVRIPDLIDREREKRADWVKEFFDTSVLLASWACTEIIPRVSPGI
jgi:hypothetical protein